MNIAPEPETCKTGIQDMYFDRNSMCKHFLTFLLLLSHVNCVHNKDNFS